MKCFRFLLLLLPLFAASYFECAALGQSPQESIITDPSISRRCDALIQQRQEKVEHRQRLLFLLDRNKTLLGSTPAAKKSIAAKLRENQHRTIQELKITNLKVIKIEEQIVRRGCPGLTL